ncbi:MAG: hypothetical protein E7261_11240 [Lachnospiraceae bacterium]|nr:hypothetical protein [Lachnospiraceae bacterium]
MKKKVKKYYVIVLMIIVVLVAGCVFLEEWISSEQRLSEKQIAELREQYPICGINIPATISMRKSSLTETKEIAESFVYGKVVGDMSTYSISASAGNASLDNKREENELIDTFDFYEYTIAVIEDTAGKYAEGELITIAANTAFIDFNPKLIDGMQVVVPVVEDSEVDGRNYYTVFGMYYVTEERYVIAAYDEEQLNDSKDVFGGIKVDSLMKKLKN